MTREMYIKTVPHTNANTTDKRIAETIPIARAVLMYSPSIENVICSSVAILKSDTATAEPSKQKMSDTVVDVGRPSEL